MARDDQGWNQNRSRQRWREEQERGRPRGSEWGDPQDTYGNRGDEGRWGAAGGRGYWRGSYSQYPEQEGFGVGRPRGEWEQQGWGSYTRGREQGGRGEYGAERGQDVQRDYHHEQGGEQGRPRSGFGNTADGIYGGAGYGSSTYGSSSGFSAGGGYQGSWGPSQPMYEPYSPLPHQQSFQQSYPQPSPQTAQPSYIGRGPKGWRRSDDRIREDVNEQLERHPQIDATDIEVNVEDGEVTLSGTASDRRMKRMAEDVAEGVAGVRDVQNHIRVKRESGVLSQLVGGDEKVRAPSRTERGGSQSTTPASGATPGSGTAGASAGGQTTTGSASASSSTKGNR